MQHYFKKKTHQNSRESQRGPVGLGENGEHVEDKQHREDKHDVRPVRVTMSTISPCQHDLRPESHHSWELDHELRLVWMLPLFHYQQERVEFNTVNTHQRPTEKDFKIKSCLPGTANLCRRASNTCFLNFAQGQTRWSTVGHWVSFLRMQFFYPDIIF